MKYFLISVFSLFLFINGFSQTLEYIPPSSQVNPSNELLTGTPFSLRAYLNLPANCTKARLSYTIPSDIHINQVFGSSFVPVNQWECNTNLSTTCYSNGDIVIESIVDLAAQGNSSQDNSTTVEINHRLKNGTPCDGDQYDIVFSVEYFDINGVSCGSPTNTNTISIIAKHSTPYWTASVTRLTPDTLICKGSFIKYKLKVPYKSGIGGYNLTNGSLNFSHQGKMLFVYDENYNEITSATTTNLGCNNVTSIPRSFTVGQSSRFYYIVVDLECGGCDYESLYFDANSFINGDPPCQSAISLTTGSSNFSPSLVSEATSCCGTGGNSGLITSTKTATEKPWGTCPGQCSPVTYKLTFDNTNSSNDLSYLYIADQLPPNFVVTSISLDPFAVPASTYFNIPGRNINVSVSTTNGSTWYPYTSDGTVTTLDPVSDMGIPPGTPVTNINLFYSGIRAFADFIRVNVSGYFNEDAPVGQVYTNCANFTGPQVSKQECKSITMEECQPLPYANTSLYDQSYPNSVLQTLVDNKFTIRMRIYNSGSSEIENGSIMMNLPDDLSFCAGTEQFYFGTSSYTTSGLTNTIPTETGGNFTVNGQLITFDGFDLPSVCNGSKYLLVDFDVYLYSLAIAQPHVLQFDASADGLPNINVSGATLYINGEYTVSPNLSVSCTPFDCEESGDTIAYVSPGDTVYFKYSLQNFGNTLLTTTDIVNHIPRPSDFSSDCGALRGSGFKINYTMADAYMECDDFDMDYYYQEPDFCPSTINDPFSISSTTMLVSTQDTLWPDSTMEFIFQAVVDPLAPLGTVAYNDFGYSFLRSDSQNGQPTPVQLSNQVKIYTSPVECGEYTSSSQIDCEDIDLVLGSTNLSSPDTCCIAISLDENPYGNLFDYVKLDVNTGEYIDLVIPGPHYDYELLGDGSSIKFIRSDGFKILTGPSYIGTICYDPLYSSPQVAQVVLIADTIGMEYNIEFCPVTFENNCGAIELEESWTKFFGGSENLISVNVKSYGNHIYASSYKTTNGGSPYTPVFVKFNLDGTIVWQREYTDHNSIYRDFEVSEDLSEIITIGLTYPAGSNDNNLSLITRINAINGEIIEGKSYNDVGRERFEVISKHDYALNSNFPYYVLGVYGGVNDKPILKNMDESGNINWEVELHKGSDDQFFNTIIEKIDGNLVITGTDPNSGNHLTLITVDGSNGNVINSKRRDVFAFPGRGFDFGEGIAIASYLQSGLIPNVSIFDYDFNLIKSIEFSNLGPITSFFKGENDKLYGISYNTTDPGPGGGGGGDQSRKSMNLPESLVDSEGLLADYNNAVIIEMDLSVTNTSPLAVDFEYIQAFEFSVAGEDFGSNFLFGGNLNKLIFANRVNHYVNVGGGTFSTSWDQYIGILDYDLTNSNCLDPFVADTVSISYSMFVSSVSDLTYTSPTPNLFYESDSSNFECNNVCIPDCISDFEYLLSLPATDCGIQVDFTNLSTNTDGNYLWNFGDFTYSNDENPTHIYDSPGIYNVCLSIPECPDVFCQKIKILFDTKLPILNCPMPQVIFCADASCLGYRGAPDFSLTSGNINCTDTLITRSDGQSLDFAYPLGSTFITIEIFNNFGASTQCIVEYIVYDCTDPDITCPQDITVMADYDDQSAQVFWNDPMSSDNCTDTISFGQTHYSGDLFPCGTTTVSIIAYDYAGNFEDCSFSITVECDTTSSKCGQAVITCFPGFINNSPAQGIDFAAPVLGIVDIRDRSSISPGYWNSQSGPNIYHPNSWSAANLGLIFGITIDNSDNVYVSATTIYGCDAADFSAFGPGGASGIYKIDPSDNITTIITTGPYDTNGTGTTIPNNGGGLGNITYNTNHEMCYVSNLSDGKIYQINNLGQVSNQYDPFVATANNLEFAPLGDRPWGIAYNAVDNSLYFSNWVEDRERRNTSEKNTIYKVDLDNNGDIVLGSETLVVEIPDHIDRYNPSIYNNYSNPVSDISFSHDGLMLIGERSMSNDCGEIKLGLSYAASKYAHNSRVLEYQENCAGWNLSDGHGNEPFTNLNADLKFRVGSHSSTNKGANSAGGVDYGYSSIEDGMDVSCSEMVWSSADYMWQCSPQYRIYGMQGIESSGGHECNSYLIDYDGQILTSQGATSVKTMQGDVEVFRCYECPEPPIQTCCSTFNNNSISNWNTIAASVSTNSTGPSLTAGDYYLRASDGSGESWIYNEIDFNGDWTEYNGACLNWDYRIFNDGSSSALNVSPILRIFSGSPTAPTLEAQFVSNIILTENEAWVNISAPIEIGTTNLPNNDLGEWIMTTGSGVNDWNTLLASVDGIRYYMDLTSSPSEIYGFDNICIGECGTTPTTQCPGFTLSSIQQDLTSSSCCFTYDMNYAYPNDTIQDELKLRILTPGVTFGTFTSDSLINNDYARPDREKGVIAGIGSVYFCLNNAPDGPASTQIEVSSIKYLADGTNYIICKDTIPALCAILPPTPVECWEISEYQSTCIDDIPFTTNGNDSGYEIKIKIKNNSSSEIFESLVLTFDDASDFFWNPTTYFGFGPNGLAPGEISDWIYFVMSPNSYISSATDICFNIHPVNTAGNFCCSEPNPYCITVLPCCDASTSFDIDLTPVTSSDQQSCCYDVSLSNDCAFNHVKSVEIECTQPGVSFLSHFDTNPAWTTVSVSDKILQFESTDDFLPKGDFQNIYQICLNNITSQDDVPQTLDVRWITCDTLGTGDDLIYHDTLLLNCQPVIQDTCAMIINDSIRCVGIEMFEFDFTVINNTDHTISTIALIPQNGTLSTSYYPQTFDTYLSPDESEDFTISLFGDVNDIIDFKIRLFDAFNNDPTEMNYCCYQQDFISTTLENCCNDILVIETDPIANGDYYATQKIVIKGNIESEGLINLHSPLVEVPSPIDVGYNAQVNIDTDGCFENGSLHFDGVDDYIGITNTSALTGDFTIAGWFKLDGSVSGSESRIFSTVTSPQELEIGIEVNQKFWVYEQGSAVNTSFGPQLNDNEWYHFAWSKIGNVRRIFIDGNEEFSYSHTRNSFGPNMRLGKWTGAGNVGLLQGQIDQFYVLTGTYEQSYVNDSLYCEDLVNVNDVFLHYNFNQAIPYADNNNLLALEDQGNNGINGTFTNFGLVGPNSNFVDEFMPIECCIEPPQITCVKVILNIDTNTQQASINSEGFINTSISPCDLDLAYSFNATDFNDTLLTVGCSDVGMLSTHSIYVMDTEGQIDSCVGQLMVIDPTGACEN